MALNTDVNLSGIKLVCLCKFVLKHIMIKIVASNLVFNNASAIFYSN